MLMSIFSSIDAFCAESLSRQKLHFSNSNSTAKQSLSTENTKTNDADHSPPKHLHSSPEVKKPSKPQFRPRFALELDGVNCFETIVPY
ncbi:hypothetical protein CTI12_AA032250 [Artemisia annua]|uniref:Uncharacterized protein n=1 Tax=Artemisia annua TaxID=35608 RepID=A0A2U1QGK6_ARTAN|nr:hypothetical protein CTI12_AA032250 [Artemisia annua]